MKRQLTEREALDLIRATATQGVPNCINLNTIDSILARTMPATAPSDAQRSTEAPAAVSASA